jgi:glycosyltransferase involved in cell wall biosynthesis
MNRNVLIIQPRIPQFRVEYFNGIIALARDSEINLSIAIPSDIDDSRKDESSNLVPHFSCRRIRFGLGRFRFDIMRLRLKIHNPDLIILEHAMRTFLIFLYLKLRGLNVALWGHGVNYTSKESVIANRLKQWMARKAFYYFVYTEGGKQKLLKQGLASSRIHIMNNTISNPFLVPGESSQVSSEIIKNDFIEKHGLENKKVLIFVGGIDSSKRLEFLLRSFYEISTLDPMAILLIFGDGPDRLRLQRLNSSNKVIFLGAANTETKRLLAEIAVCILMPGRVGLIAVDSFQMRLPIITTSYEFHAPEFEYLINGKNSLISKNNVKSYVTVVTNYLRDTDLQKLLKQGAQESEGQYRLVDMQERFVQKLNEILNLRVA